MDTVLHNRGLEAAHERETVVEIISKARNWNIDLLKSKLYEALLMNGELWMTITEQGAGPREHVQSKSEIIQSAFK